MCAYQHIELVISIYQYNVYIERGVVFKYEVGTTPYFESYLLTLCLLNYKAWVYATQKISENSWQSGLSWKFYIVCSILCTEAINVSESLGLKAVPWYAYLSSHFIVVEVHESPGVLLDLSGVHKHLGEAETVADVGGATAPLPAFILVIETLFLLIAAAATQRALGAGGRDGMGDPGGDDGVGESSLFTPCKPEEINIYVYWFVDTLNQKPLKSG